MVKELQKTAKTQDIPTQVFNPFKASKKYSYQFFAPSENLRDRVDSHWSMHWDLSGQDPFKLELASSPYIAFTFTEYGSFATGIHTGVYSYTIAGKGTLYGTLFKPTRFYDFYQKPLSELTNKELPLASLFPQFNETFNKKLLSSPNDSDAIKIIEQHITSLKPSKDTHQSLLTDRIIDYSAQCPVQTIKQLSEHFSLSERSLHKLLHDCVGVGIKWITLRDRLQKAMYISANSESKPNWTNIAFELGYNDQSHFINDFKRIIGMSPNRYYQLLYQSR